MLESHGGVPRRGRRRIGRGWRHRYDDRYDAGRELRRRAEIAEVIAVKGTLSDADLATTQAYLSAKFGL
jgi:hypothetical protein